ncbi:DUF3237 domain-containing protein [Pseudoprimorskyibacter insulae]|uniref:UPF0311 protein PRI8871_00639 n=1 Tax=Pseudoprimorskyibacter insulae TaxID=1695997 RepID=A0A2R8APZ6_9RHOB|nr:DUF3237 domain-containing protein [Pseudoprimorskyibacter insulae]SPF78050.1 hypothetical protein PRI8871_00639 [Pseudoprimorskyibacter insulae]
MLPEPKLELIMELEVCLDPIIEMGPGRAGLRRIIPIIGGIAKGPKIKGKILNVGADWQTIFADGNAELVARYAVETDDGAVIEIDNRGFRNGPAEVLARVAKGEDVDPADYYMRTIARLETSHPDYSWVNKRVFVATGARLAGAVHIAFYCVE